MNKTMADYMGRLFCTGKTGQKTLKRINQLLQDISSMVTRYRKPVGDFSGWWSRRIDDPFNRLVYE